MTLKEAIDLAEDCQLAVPGIECSVRRTVNRHASPEGWKHSGKKWYDDYRFWITHLLLFEECSDGVNIVLSNYRPLKISKEVAESSYWAVLLRKAEEGSR